MTSNRLTEVSCRYASTCIVFSYYVAGKLARPFCIQMLSCVCAITFLQYGYYGVTPVVGTRPILYRWRQKGQSLIHRREVISLGYSGLESKKEAWSTKVN